MSDKFSFREINPMDRKEAINRGGSFLDVALFNNYSDFSDEVIESVVAKIEKEGVDYSLTLIDLTGSFNDGGRIGTILKKFPTVRIFLAGEDKSFFETINLYFNESRANFIMIISAGLITEEFDINAVISSYREKPALFGVLPLVNVNGKSESTFYKYSLNNDNIFISMDKFSLGGHCIAPYKFTALFDKDKFIMSDGFDCDFRNKFVGIMDLIYRAYLRGGLVSGIEKFVFNDVSFGSNNKSFDNIDTDFSFDLKLFMIKNILDINIFSLLIKIIFIELIRFNFLRIKMIFRFYKKRSSTGGLNVRNDSSILELFN